MSLPALESTPDYLEHLQSHIIYYLKKESPAEKTLYNIIANAKGAYPLDVLYILKKEGITYIEDKQAYLVKDKVALLHLSKTVSSNRMFSDPHPADYDWRFDASTASFIVNHSIKNLGKCDGEIALLGAKTLYPLLINKGYPAKLYIKSSSLIKELKDAGFEHGLIEADLLNPIKESLKVFSAVIADPPWYNEFYEAFMLRSSELLHIGGKLYLSVLPELTRPSAKEDRARIIELASSMGLVFIDELEGELSYETPRFEYNSLIANGVFCANWRKGDLWVFKKENEIDYFIKQWPVDENEQWVEFTIGNKKIKLREKKEMAFKAFEFYPADPKGFTFSFVSRRSPLRKMIDLWTSDNIALRIDNLPLVELYLKNLEKGCTISEVSSMLDQDINVSSYEKNRLLELIKIIVTGQIQ
ncbi:hypothetical protein ACSX1A_17500 [Pontibacter sp. MBLB2868]|uniref:hypothetical protein n=1 Tax=Pontibacter sp. MBLB2868 TaxID=3451555 RepID=UPI003F757197